MITLKSLRAKQTSKVKFLLRSAQSSELSVISDLQILQKQVAVYQILNGTKKNFLFAAPFSEGCGKMLSLCSGGSLRVQVLSHSDLTKEKSPVSGTEQTQLLTAEAKRFPSVSLHFFFSLN